MLINSQICAANLRRVLIYNTVNILDNSTSERRAFSNSCGAKISTRPIGLIASHHYHSPHIKS